MPLETGTFISDLVDTNPAHTDPLSQTDSHLRLIKSAIKTTFPNINAAVTASDEDLNNLAGTLTSGVSVLKDTGVFFDTNHFDGFTNPAEGLVAITATDTAGTASAPVATFNGNTLKTSLAGALEVVGKVSADGDLAVTGNETVTGNLTVTGSISGPGSVPVGAVLEWYDDALPTGPWAWANGGTLSRTANPILFALWGTKFGTGDGSTTFNVVDRRNTTAVGKSTMGSASDRGLLAGITSSLLTTLGSLFGIEKQSLGTANMPQQTVNVSGHIIVTANRPYGEDGADVPHFTPPGGGTSAVAASAADTPVSSGDNTMTGTIGNATPTPVEIVQPSTTAGFIIRIG